MDFNCIRVEEKDSILLVTVNRPKAMNALNNCFFDEMDVLISKIKDREDLKVVVITGEGKAFVAGADIAEMVHMNSAEGSAFSAKGQNTFNSLEKLAMPVIAAINGFALGGGCELAMACDFRIASSKAKFGQPEVNLGLIPGYAGTQRLPRLIGMANALYLLTTADMINANEALSMGLVQKVVEPDDLMETVMGIATNIASKGPKAVRKVKEVTRNGMNTYFTKGSTMESNEFGSLFGNEGTKGMTAFLEKRKPEW